MKSEPLKFTKENLLRYMRGCCIQNEIFRLSATTMESDQNIYISFHGYRPFPQIKSSTSYLFVLIKPDITQKPKMLCFNLENMDYVTSEIEKELNNIDGMFTVICDE